MELLDEANLANAFDFVVSPLEKPQMNTRPQWGSGGAAAQEDNPPLNSAVESTRGV